MSFRAATAIAHPNIAFIKYWGNRDPIQRIPVNGSLSMNLNSLYTRTRVIFSSQFFEDRLTINKNNVGGSGLKRVSAMLNQVRQLSGLNLAAKVESETNFPTGAGIASSASAFAALSLAANAAAGLQLDEPALSRLARSGSGSASRSVPGGFVEWQAGQNDEDSFAFSIAPPEHWALADCIAVVNHEHKATGSTAGHQLAASSPFQPARVQSAPQRLKDCRESVLNRDFERFAAVVEQDCNMMHAVMMTSQPPLIYWQAATLEIIHAVRAWQQAGNAVCYTIDAGPNVHVICPFEQSPSIIRRLKKLPGVQEVLVSSPGGPARIISE